MYQEDVRKKVFLDIFAAPSTLGPIVGGATIALISWAVDVDASFIFGGIGAMLIGGGILANRLIFGLEGLTENAFKYLQNQKKEKFQLELDELDAQLTSNRDARDQNTLRQIRMMYENYKQQVQDGNIPSDYDLNDKLETLFHACVNQLRHSYELWKSAKSLVGDAKTSVLEERDGIIDEVIKSVEYFGKSIEEFHVINAKQSSSNLARIRKELGETLEGTRKTEERVRERLANLDQPVKIHGEAEFE